MLQGELSRLSEINNSLAIFCMATYGEGDPTDNAQDFYDWLQENDDESLSGLNYTVSLSGQRFSAAVFLNTDLGAHLRFAWIAKDSKYIGICPGDTGVKTVFRVAKITFVVINCGNHTGYHNALFVCLFDWLIWPPWPLTHYFWCPTPGGPALLPKLAVLWGYSNCTSKAVF